jgi:hypothetical protein
MITEIRVKNRRIEIILEERCEGDNHNCICQLKIDDVRLGPDFLSSREAEKYAPELIAQGK